MDVPETDPFCIVISILRACVNFGVKFEETVTFELQKAKCDRNQVTKDVAKINLQKHRCFFQG